MGALVYCFLSQSTSNYLCPKSFELQTLILEIIGNGLGIQQLSDLNRLKEC